MSLYVPNIKLPPSCFLCPFSSKIDPENILCEVSGETFEERFFHFDNRKEDCPLIELGAHGRLIDGDKLRASFAESVHECHEWAEEIDPETEMSARVSQSLGCFVEASLRTKAQPTIIPAEADNE